MSSRKLVVFTLVLLMPWAATALPFPNPEPERIFPCTGTTDVTSCGKQATCEFNREHEHGGVVGGEMHTNSTYVCTCDEKYGTLAIDDAPCTRERTSKLLAFCLQLFFGWIGVGAFVLHWWWYALATFIALGIAVVSLCCMCGCCPTQESDEGISVGGYVKCLQCMFTMVVLSMWITNTVYITTDCHSVVEVTGKEYALQCWENM